MKLTNEEYIMITTALGLGYEALMMPVPENNPKHTRADHRLAKEMLALRVKMLG